MSLKKENIVKISVITATYNAAEHLPALIASLRNQTDKGFEWVVADGGSTDGTLDSLNAIAEMNLVVSTQADFGIYDALNRAIKLAKCDYYIVCGADDIFAADTIEHFKKTIQDNPADLIVANATYNAQSVSCKNNMAWLRGHSAVITSHVLATAIKKNLHEQYGYYSRKYPIAADQLFILKLNKNQVTRALSNFNAGTIGATGISSVDKIGNAIELYRVQLELNESFITQTILLFARLSKVYISKLFSS